MGFAAWNKRFDLIDLICNNWSKNFDKRPHRKGGFFTAGSLFLFAGVLKIHAACRYWRLKDPFCSEDCSRDCQFLLSGLDNPPHYPLPWALKNLHWPPWFLGPSDKSVAQTPSRSVQPFFARLTNVTDTLLLLLLLLLLQMLRLGWRRHKKLRGHLTEIKTN